MTTAKQWFDAASGEQAQILARLRKLVLSSDSGLTESVKWSRPCYARNALFCYLHRAKTHVTIGFHHGAELRDPGSLLEGTGKGMRHVKIKSLAELDETAIAGLVQEALALDTR